MPISPLVTSVSATVMTIAVGGFGAGAALALDLPAWVLMGPALAVSLCGLAGLQMKVADPVRDICFVILGLGVGAGFDSQTGAAMMRWPLAFLMLGLSLIVTMILCRLVLMRGFGFGARSASLASAPGHLSFVLGLAMDLGSDVARITVVQSIRLLFLTISVPFIARAMGYAFDEMSLGDGPPIALPTICVLVLASLAVGLLFHKLRLPAPLLLAAMTVSAAGHATDLTPGTIPPAMLTPAFLVLGTMIGTRFAGLRRDQLFSALPAGLAVTLISVLVAALAALPVAAALGMPTAHVLTAFAPGGLETMIALGATMGASPGFIVASHVARLMILLVLIPLFLGRQRRA
ncbi:AbrB family transcriptional regulator [Rhodobacteraceae bacterium F11138]|nr:AbrB family transcriptional regulator [Rhodobacteraceae bacterium F11138]